jgi:hypothetical protein
MSRQKAHTPEEIVAKLRRVEVLTEQTYYRWRAEFG